MYGCRNYSVYGDFYEEQRRCAGILSVRYAAGDGLVSYERQPIGFTGGIRGFTTIYDNFQQNSRIPVSPVSVFY